MIHWTTPFRHDNWRNKIKKYFTNESYLITIKCMYFYCLYFMNVQYVISFSKCLWEGKFWLKVAIDLFYPSTIQTHARCYQILKYRNSFCDPGLSLEVNLKINAAVIVLRKIRIYITAPILPIQPPIDCILGCPVENGKNPFALNDIKVCTFCRC